MVAVLLIALLGADAEPEPAPNKKVIASADWYSMRHAPRVEAGKHLVLRSVSELVQAIPTQAARGAAPEVVEKQVGAEAAKLLGVKSIDWKKEMLVVVAGGRCPTNGHRVEVLGTKTKGETLTVSWKLHKPKDGGDDVITFPAQLALVPAHKGKVVFEQAK